MKLIHWEIIAKHKKVWGLILIGDSDWTLTFCSRLITKLSSFFIFFLSKFSTLWNFTKIWGQLLFYFIQGYDLVGMEKLPDKGPALLIYYHGALPLDMYYILSRLLLCKKRRLRNVAATFLFHIPGIVLLWPARLK